jgi:hypothetical protein
MCHNAKRNLHKFSKVFFSSFFIFSLRKEEKNVCQQQKQQQITGSKVKKKHKNVKKVRIQRAKSKTTATGLWEQTPTSSVVGLLSISHLSTQRRSKQQQQ